MTKRLLIKIEYDGGPFVGWQRQKEGLSVQGAIEDAATAFINNPVQIAGAGRTDSGVHALGQMAHLDVPEKFTTNRVVEALNSHLYNLPITIRSAVQVPKDFHARFQAIRRCYLYRILPRRQPPALNKERVWHHKQSLDASLMIKAAKFLTGKHDFSSFRSSSCQAESPVKTLDRLEA